MATQNRRIVGGIIQGGRIHKAGDEERLAKLLSPRAIQRLLEAGQLEGDWGVPMVDRGPVDAVPVTVTDPDFTATTKEPPKAAPVRKPARKPAVKKSPAKKGR